MPTDIKVVLRSNGVLETVGELDERTASSGKIDIKENGDIHNELIEEPLAAQELKAYSGSNIIVVKEFREGSIFIPIDPEGTLLENTEQSITTEWVESLDPDFVSYVVYKDTVPF